MLTELRIRNFAIIEQLTLPLAEGFNVLSGETGAGKSIIVGALGLLLGERASADLIRSGAEKATVEGVFDVAKVKGIAALADERGIDVEDDTRVLENADELRTLASSLGELLSAEEGSVLSQLGAAQRPLTSIERIDPSASRMQELFDTAFYALQELARSVEDYAGSVDLDPARL